MSPAARDGASVPGAWNASSRRPSPEVDESRRAQGADPGRVGRPQVAEEVDRARAEHAARAGEQALRVDEVTGAGLVHDDLRAREGLGEVTDAARVVEVDVRDHDRRSGRPARSPSAASASMTVAAEVAVPVSTRHGRLLRMAYAG